jgi:hypothetical protein
MSAPQPGWYVNPSGPGRRFWDGERWTDHIDDTPATPYTSPSGYAPPPVQVAQAAYPPPQPPAAPGQYGSPYVGAPGYGAPPAQSQQVGSLVILGYVFAILIPIVGLILGIVAATRQNEPQTSKHGIFVIVASVLAFVVWLLIINSTGNTYTY